MENVENKNPAEIVSNVSESPVVIEFEDDFVRADFAEIVSRTQSLKTSIAQWETNPDFQKLKQLLSNEANAKILITSYQHHDNFLTENARKLLVHTFINKKKYGLLKNYSPGNPLDDWIIEKDEFLYFANTVVKIFPSELIDTYYTPFRVENGERLQAAGKLVSHFAYVKGCLREDGVIQPKHAKAKGKVSSNSVEKKTLEPTEVLKLRYLENHSDDVEKVKAYWSDTHKCRKNILHLEEKSVHDYMSQFKALREQLGKDLIKLDFELEYGEKSQFLFQRWDIVKDYFTKLIKESQLSKADKAYLDILSTLSSDHQSAVIAYLLPNIIPPSQVTRNKRKRSGDEDIANGKDENSKENKKDSFILVIPNANEAEPGIENLKTVLLAKKLTLQPLTVIVGSIVKISQTFVVVDDNWYETNSFLEALDLTFKSFFAFDCKFSLGSSNIYYLIQNAIYDIPLPLRGCALKVKSTAKQIAEVLKRHGQKS